MAIFSRPVSGPSESEPPFGLSVSALFKVLPVWSIKLADSPQAGLRPFAEQHYGCIEAVCLGYSRGDKPVLHSTPWQQELWKEWAFAGTLEDRRSLSGCVFTQEQVFSARELRLHSYKFSIETISPLKMGLSGIQKEWEKKKSRFLETI